MMISDPLSSLLMHLALVVLTASSVYYVNIWFSKKELEIAETQYLDVLAVAFDMKRLKGESNHDFRLRMTKELLKKERIH